MTSPDDLSPVTEAPFVEAVDRLEGLLAQGGPAFLLGAGCSKCAGLPMTTELTELILASDDLDPSCRAILAAVKGHFSGAQDAQIEDYLSELIDLIAIADRRATRQTTCSEVVLGDKPYAAAELREAARGIKKSIASLLGRQARIETHRSFVTAVHRPSRPGKPTTGLAVDYLVLNYDTVIEDALAMERVPFADGLDGGATAWWDPGTFDRDGLAARVLKLHGSIDWVEVPNDPLPRRIAASIRQAQLDGQHVLIWPASTKYRETQRDPYAQLANRARAALRPGRGAQRVLAICGYSFGDSHINLDLDRAIRDSSGDLTVAAFTSQHEPAGLLRDWLEDKAIGNQVLVFANRGFFHGADSLRSDRDLLWWKFENLTRLLGGER